MLQRLISQGRSRPSLVLWPTLALGVLALVATTGVPWAQPPVLGPGVNVAFKQLDWLDDTGQVAGANSRAGVAEITFTSAAAGLAVGSDGAYLNLYTSIDGGTNFQLTVENLWVQFDDLSELLSGSYSALIDLGNADGTAVSEVRYQVSLTHDPVDPLVSPSFAASRQGKSLGRLHEIEGPGSHSTDFTTDFPEEPVVTDFPEEPVVTDYEIDLEEIFFQDAIDHFNDLTTNYEEPAPAPTYGYAPLPSAPVYIAPPVQHVGIGFGGFGGGGLVGFGQPPRPVPFRPVWRPGPNVPPQPQPQPPVRPGARPQPLGAVLRPVPVVNESPMSCAPSAVARSIQYMLDVRGRQGPGAQAIMGNLHNLMGTSPVHGTSMQGILNGKAAFSNQNGLGIQTVFPANAGQAANTLNNGGDVELNIIWPNSRGRGGCPGGGHVAMVTSITLLPNGNFQITYVDDSNQHDGQPRNDHHTLIVRPNGAIVSGFPCPGGVVAGLLAENMP